MALNLLLQRYSDNGNSTQGLLFELENNDLKFLNYTLEDENREVKIKGETCIPDGLYEIKFRKVLSPKTESYRNKFDWFTWHLEVQDVEGFEHIYIHIGNTEKDTDGCILVQDTANNNQIKKGFNGESTPAFKRFYNKLKRVLEEGERVYIQVRDIENLK